MHTSQVVLHRARRFARLSQLAWSCVFSSKVLERHGMKSRFLAESRKKLRSSVYRDMHLFIQSLCRINFFDRSLRYVWLAGILIHRREGTYILPQCYSKLCVVSRHMTNPDCPRIRNRHRCFRIRSNTPVGARGYKTWGSCGDVPHIDELERCFP